MSQKSHSTNSPNILVFGQTGVGKSSLINMLVGDAIAEVSADLYGCTMTADGYEIPRGNKTYTFWDTCGLNEAEEGNVPAQKAIEELIHLLEGISVSLIIYCVRGSRSSDILRVNYDLIYGVLCEARVPIVLVVTGLEQEEDMDAWWTMYEKDVKRLGIYFEGHACVTTIKGRNNMYKKEFEESRDKVWRLVEAHCSATPWALTPEWLDKVPNTMAKYIAGYNARTGKEREVLPRRPGPLAGIMHNIVLLGDAGSDKNLIINMIVGQTDPEVSSDLPGCTFRQHMPYKTSIGNTHFGIYETAGEQGRVFNWKAVHELYTLIRSLDGISLFIYCTRGRIKENASKNWILFNKVLRAKKVPIIAVEGGLENEDDLDRKRVELRKALEEYGMDPTGVECIPSVPDSANKDKERYRSSQSRLRKLIVGSYNREPCSTRWIDDIYKTTLISKLGPFVFRRVEFAKEAGNLVDKYIEEAGMKKDESDKLKSTLLDAEKKVSRRKAFGTGRVRPYVIFL